MSVKITLLERQSAGGWEAHFLGAAFPNTPVFAKTREEAVGKLILKNHIALMNLRSGSIHITTKKNNVIPFIPKQDNQGPEPPSAA